MVKRYSKLPGIRMPCFCTAVCSAVSTCAHMGTPVASRRGGTVVVVPWSCKVFKERKMVHCIRDAAVEGRKGPTLSSL